MDECKTLPVGWDPDWFEPYGDFFTSEYAGRGLHSSTIQLNLSRF